MSNEKTPCDATPSKLLRERIMDSRIPKNEAEWWASRRIEELERENAALRQDKKRLDWLAVTDAWFDYPATESFTPETFRAAIDAYMAKESSNCQGIHDSSNRGAT